MKQPVQDHLRSTQQEFKLSQELDKDKVTKDEVITREVTEAIKEAVVVMMDKVDTKIVVIMMEKVDTTIGANTTIVVIIMDKVETTLEVDTTIMGIVEHIEDKEDANQEITRDDSITYFAKYVNKMDITIYSGAQSSQSSFLEEAIPRAFHERCVGKV